jgi:predicted TPR repeat methyltransferase
MTNSNVNLDDVKLLHHEGKLEDARQGYLKLLHDNPRDVDVLHLLGLLCAEQGHLNDARTYLETARGIAPENIALRLHLANLMKAAGCYDDAENELQAVIAADASCAPAYNNLGTVYFARQAYDAAISAYHSALDIRPDYIDAYYNLGLAYGRRHQDDEAIAAYRALLAIAPQHTGGHFQLGCLLMRCRQYRDAADAFTRIAQHHPHHYESLANLAACYLHLGRLDQAATSYLRALEIMPDDRETLFNLGVIYMQQGYAQDAVNFYLRAVQAHPDYFDAHHNLGAVYLMRRDHEKALLHFREALRIQPDHQALRHTIRIMMNDQSLTASSPEYIQSLFDSYADYYDAHMLSHLHYRVPEALYAAVKQVGVFAAGKLDIVDIGCGTGLCGQLFKPHARRLTGVDLSAKMLEAAAQKNVYDELVTTDAAGYLAAHHSAFDLVLAGDVLVYFGDLAAFIAAVQSALRPGGYFAFNVEVGTAGDFILSSSGRFTHHQSYLRQLAAAKRFEIISMAPEVLRQQEVNPVAGYACLWQRLA